MKNIYSIIIPNKSLHVVYRGSKPKVKGAIIQCLVTGASPDDYAAVLQDLEQESIVSGLGISTVPAGTSEQLIDIENWLDKIDLSIADEINVWLPPEIDREEYENYTGVNYDIMLSRIVATQNAAKRQHKEIRLLRISVAEFKKYMSDNNIPNTTQDRATAIAMMG